MKTPARCVVALVAFSALLLGSAADSSAFNQTFVDAFTRASLAVNLTARQLAVTDAIDEGKTLEALVVQRLIVDPYDCLPELRTICHDVLAGLSESENTHVYEYGEWAEMDAAWKAEWVGVQITEAAERGFNLFTEAELSRR